MQLLSHHLLLAVTWKRAILPLWRQGYETPSPERVTYPTLKGVKLSFCKRAFYVSSFFVLALFVCDFIHALGVLKPLTLAAICS